MQPITTSERLLRVPAWMVQSMHRLPGIEYKILSLVAFKNQFDNATREFSVRYLAAKIGEPKSTVQVHLSRMLKAGLVLEAGRGRRGIRRLALPNHCPFTTPVRTPVPVRNRTDPEPELSRQAVPVQRPTVHDSSVPEWERARSALKRALPEAFFRTFVDPLTALSTEGRLRLSGAGAIVSHAEQRYRALIEQVAGMPVEFAPL